MKNGSPETSHRVQTCNQDNASSSFLHRNKGDGGCGVNELFDQLQVLVETRLKAESDERKKTAADDAKTDDWVFAGRVIDRLCFYVFGACLLVGSLVIFILAATIP